MTSVQVFSGDGVDPKTLIGWLLIRDRGIEGKELINRYVLPKQNPILPPPPAEHSLSNIYFLRQDKVECYKWEIYESFWGKVDESWLKAAGVSFD